MFALRLLLETSSNETLSKNLLLTDRFDKKIKRKGLCRTLERRDQNLHVNNGRRIYLEKCLWDPSVIKTKIQNCQVQYQLKKLKQRLAGFSHRSF